MDRLMLYIGSPARSSWSLRPWLFARHHGLPCEHRIIDLQAPDRAERIAAVSPSGRVPVLHHGAVEVWESLAICDYFAETFQLPEAWPDEPAARATARSLACEMHAGFAELRRALPFDALREPAPLAMPEDAVADIARIGALIRDARQQYGDGGDWLFGSFGIVDAMYAPVIWRLHSYAVPLVGFEQDYARTVLAHPALQAWIALARKEVGRLNTDAVAEVVEPAPVSPLLRSFLLPSD